MHELMQMIGELLYKSERCWPHTYLMVITWKPKHEPPKFALAGYNCSQKMSDDGSLLALAAKNAYVKQEIDAINIALTQVMMSKTKETDAKPAIVNYGRF